MSKILFIGDPHLKISRFDKCISFLNWINNQIAKHKPDMVINLGDTFDNHAVLRSEILGEFRQHVDFVVNELKIPYYYILGNHDFFKPKDNKYHALQSYIGLYDDFVIVDKRMDIDNITMVPFMANLDDFPKDTLEICIAHQTFIGADYSYHRPEAGVNADHVAAKVIISGHVHKKQSFGKVIYPGTPYAHNVNDIDMVKGISLFDTDTYQETFIESPFTQWRSIEFNISEEQSINDFHNTLKSSLNNTDHWIVKVVGPKVEITAYLRSAKYKKLVKDKHVTPKPKFTDKQKQKLKIEAVSDHDIVKEYVEKVYKGSIDKKKILSKALEIMGKHTT